MSLSPEIAALQDFQRRDQFALEQLGAAAIMRHGGEHAKHRQLAHVALAEVALQSPDRHQIWRGTPKRASICDNSAACRLSMARAPLMRPAPTRVATYCSKLF
jgi:hypothetical protein